MSPDTGVLLEAALRGDHQAVRRACTAALAEGYPIADLVVDVLAPIQQQVGARWLAAEISVADEHRATAALDSVLAAIELALPAPTEARPVICVCAEGEWHAMAARMLALVLGSRGWPVVFLGPSLPAADLATVARETEATAVAISTSSVAALPGAARCVRAAVGAARPVVVGGQAFSAVPGAAAALGASVFGDPRDAAAAMGDLPLTTGPVGVCDEGVLALDAAERDLAACTADALVGRHPVDPAQRPALHEAAGYAVGLARAAVLLNDRSVMTSHLDWLETFIGGRDLQLRGVDLLEAVGDAGSRLLDDPRQLHDVLVA